MKKIICTVTNDLNYDQRMQRICTSLQNNGYDITLVGVSRKSSIQLQQQIFHQKRIKIYFETGLLFYAEYNIKLLFYLLFKSFDAVCAIDLDTIIPCYFASILRRKKRVFDAHEIFTEMKEVLNNKNVFAFWTMIEKKFVPKFKYGYTVNKFLKDEFYKRYQSSFEIIRNIPSLKNTPELKNGPNAKPFLIYQGAVNEGRGFEQLIPAMKNINCELRIYGKGNFFKQTEALIKLNNVEDKVKLMGAILPDELSLTTPTAICGITIFEQEGMNQYYSLANRFFDYMMSGIPQICVDYPEYKAINNEYNIALLIKDIQPETIANAVAEILENTDLYTNLKNNCLIAREKLNWQNEEKKLINYWNKIL